MELATVSPLIDSYHHDSGEGRLTFSEHNQRKDLSPWSGRAHGNSMKSSALNFPNPSRSYDDTGHGVRFWGYDQTFEIAFFVEDGALSKVNPETRADEAGFLHTFDDNRDRICKVAGGVYSRRRKASYIYAYTLTESDF